jgi:large subunit ribosomal protein L18
MTKNLKQTQRRRTRTRFAVKDAARGRARLSVFRSGKHIYAQIINDDDGKTVAAASTVDKDLKAQVKSGSKDSATLVGKLIAERAGKAGVKEVVFDRGSYKFHGCIKALADAAREAGLSF